MADVKITDLGSAVSVDVSDFLVVDTGVDTLKATAAQLRNTLVGDISSLTTTAKSSAVAAINEVKTATTNNATAIAKCEVLEVTLSSVSSLPQTVSNASVESDMVCVNSVLSNPAAQTGDWTVTTSSGSLTLSGNISGTTNVTLYLMKSR